MIAAKQEWVQPGSVVDVEDVEWMQGPQVSVRTGVCCHVILTPPEGLESLYSTPLPQGMTR